MMDLPMVYNFDAPMYVDHVHQRLHQHNSLLGIMGRRAPDQRGHPNIPDVDVSEADDYFYVDIEVPGIRDSKAMTLQWIGTRTLVVSGTSSGGHSGEEDVLQYSVPSGAPEALDKVITNENIDGKQADGADSSPRLIVAERRMGFFRREFHFPVEVEMEGLVAKLEAGILHIQVPKEISRARVQGVIKIETIGT